MDGPWDYCMYLQYEYCEEYILSQASDVYITRIYPYDYQYSRIVLETNDAGVIIKEPMRG